MPDIICSKCGESKPEIKFRKYGEGRYHSCRSCAAKVWEENKRNAGIDPDYLRAEVNRVYDTLKKNGLPTGLVNPSRLKALENKKLLLEHYSRQSELSKGLCHICKRSERVLLKRTGKIRSLARDHNHTTGLLRGVLCNSCNHGIGHFGEDVLIVAGSIDYMTFWKQEDPIFIYDYSYNQHIKRKPSVYSSCEICEKKIDEIDSKHKLLCVDHCHETLTFRGILCNGCNSGLGCFEEKRIYLEAAIEYLEFWENTSESERNYTNTNSKFQMSLAERLSEEKIIALVNDYR